MNGGNNHEPSQGSQLCMSKFMEIQTSAKPAVLWLRARQLCYLGGHAPQSGVIVGILQKLKDDMPADLADSQADEEHRKTDREPFFTAKENEEVATVTATIETNLRQGHLTEDGDGEHRGVVRVGGGAPEEQGRRTWEQIVAKEVISTVDDMVLSPCDSTDGCAQTRGCGWLAGADEDAVADLKNDGDSTDGCAQRRGCGWLANATAGGPTTPRQCRFFLFWIV